MHRLSILLFAALTSLIALPSEAAPRVKGITQSANLPALDDEVNGTIADALKLLTQKAGWSLVVTAETLDKRLSFKANKMPFMDALATVLEAGQLRAELRGSTLIVKDRDDDDDVEDDHPERGRRIDADALEEHARLAAEQALEELRAKGMPGIPPRPDKPGSQAVAPPAPPAPPRIPTGRGKNDRVAYGQDLHITESEIVHDVVVNGGDLVVAGRVTGDAVALGGDVYVEDGGIVEGDLVALGGDVHIEEGAVVRGSTTKFGGAFGGVMKEIAKRAGPPREEHVEDEHGDDDDSSFFGDLGFKFTLSVLAFILSIILIAFVPERIERIQRTMLERPTQAGAAGFVTLLGFLPFCLLLVFTIVGILLVPFAFFVLMLVYTTGYTALAVGVGRLVPVFEGKKTMLGAMGVGLAVLTLTWFVPWLGTLAVFLAATFAAGAVVLSRFGTPPKLSDAAPF